MAPVGWGHRWAERYTRRSLGESPSHRRRAAGSVTEGLVCVVDPGRSAALKYHRHRAGSEGKG